MYVVGCMGNDKELGRTFLCRDWQQVAWSLAHLLEENEESKEYTKSVITDMIGNNLTTSDGEFLTYFIGHLEEY